MPGGGFEVDPAELEAAAGRLRVTVEDGTRELQCIAWGQRYGHEALAAALVQLVTDADKAVEQASAKVEALAVGLEEQAEDYRSTDAAAQTRLAPGPWMGPPTLPTTTAPPWAAPPWASRLGPTAVGQGGAG
ncbi:hypothetical protein GXB85_17220 [Cellulomonas sp. APG4]|nr:hypothetical protein [Cellulomonas sp. APG4]